MRKWIKINTSKIDDLRFSLVSDISYRIYDMLYLLAGILDTDGLLSQNGKPLTENEIAYRLRIDISQLKKSIRELSGAKIDLLRVTKKGILVNDWKHEQIDMNRVREQTKERVTRYRKHVTNGNTLQDSVTPLEQEQEQEQEESKKRKEQASKTALHQSTNADASMPAASRDALNANANPEEIAKSMTWMKPVLISLGIKGKRLEDTLSKVTTRSYNGTLKHHVLGNIATVYADERKKNKPIVIAMRLENHEPPLPEFLKPETWHVIPKNILKSAGIDDLTEMFTRPELKPFKPDGDEKVFIPMPENVREKLKGLARSKSRK